MTITYEAAAFRKGRSTVMGVATLLVIWFHSAILVNPDSILGHIKAIGDIGVDMFLFASGVGVYFALKKHGRFWPYLQSRLYRILPAYLLVAIPWFAYQDIILGGSRRLFLKDITMLTFWLEGRMTFWYVSAILLLYILTPVYVKLWNRFAYADRFSVFFAYAVTLLVLAGKLDFLDGPAMILIPRIPVYLAGLCFGKAMHSGHVFRMKAVWVCLIMAVCGLLLAGSMGWIPWMLPVTFKYIAFGPLAVMLSLACTRIPENRFTGFWGQRSLETYLLLEKVQVTLGNRRDMEPLMENGAIPFFLLAFGITMVLVELLRWLTSPFRKGLGGRLRLDNSRLPK